MHSGVRKMKRGLDPQTKLLIDSIRFKKPAIKLTSLCIQLELDLKAPLSTEMRKQVDYYFYNTNDAKHELGISSYGTLHTLCEALQMNIRLASPTADLDTCGIIGHILIAAEGRVLIMFSTIKLLMTMYLETVQGYSSGMYLMDYTYRIMSERLPLLVVSTHDIGQHGKVGAFGPSSHGDLIQSRNATGMVKAFLDKLLVDIYTNNLNPVWSASVREKIMTTYSSLVVPTRLNYLPGTGLSDCADAIGNGAGPVLSIESTQWKSCWVHIWRAFTKLMKQKMVRSDDESLNMLYTDMSFLHELSVKALKPKLIQFFIDKWTERGENELLEYMKKEFLTRNFSRCDGEPGEATDTCTLEAINRVLKRENYFNSVESAASVVERAPSVGELISRTTTPLLETPPVNAATWKKAQSLVKRGWQNLGFAMGGSFIFPSEKLLDDHIPADCKTVDEVRTHIKQWAAEYRNLLKNPTGYYKLTDGSWDFDILVDMLFSFWVLTPIPTSHKKYFALREVGIVYTCTCPQFNHYHVCKHCVALAIYKKECGVPEKFSTVTVGKRKAIAGVALSKRGKCLQIDA